MGYFGGGRWDTNTPFSGGVKSVSPLPIGPTIVVAFSVIGAYKLSQHFVGSKNRKDHYVVFFFTSAIFVSIIVWLVSAIFYPPFLAT